jgi:ABC-2 type transport system ATP-binding protein
MSSPLLHVHDVTVRHGQVEALTGVTFEALPGVTVLLGRAGAGKTSLCRVLAGTLTPARGTVRWTADGAAPVGRRDYLRTTGWLPQSFDAPPTMTVRQYLEYAAWLKEVRCRVLHDSVDAALAAVELVDRAHSLVSTLSGGMMQRLGIAQALVNRPSLVILDEPTAGLDPEQRARVHGIVRSLATDRVVLLATPLVEDAVALADRVLVLDRGTVRHDGPMSELEGRGSDTGADRLARLRDAVLSTASPT